MSALLGLALPGSLTTAQTVVINTPARMADSAKMLWQAGAGLLKIRLDQHGVKQRMLAVRAAVLTADANESWQGCDLRSCCQLLADFDKV